MKTIFKYKFPVKDGQVEREGKLWLPRSANVISTGLDLQGDFCVWALVDPTQTDLFEFAYKLVWTGEKAPDYWKFLGTVKYGGSVIPELVYHVFIRPYPKGTPIPV